jgi:hypothetical protein
MRLFKGKGWRGFQYFPLIVTFAFPSALAFGQSLEEYKKASESSGCGLIPYQSLRGDCVDAENSKDKACDQKFGCGQDLDKREREEIARRISNGEACLARREAVAAIFERARASLRNESVAEVRPFASKSADKIESLQPGHKKAIEDAKAAIFNCKQLAQ